MEIFKVKNLSFKYPETDDCAIKDLSFSINQGDFTVLCGLSGSGKSTLLKCLKPVLAPCGEKMGEIYYKQKKVSELSLREQTSKIGFVMQSPDNQIVTDKVWHELAFGLENLGIDNNIVKKRVAETACYFGIQNWFEMNVSELSGGQKQILNLASIMSMQPEVIILDEPTSQLDPIASAEFLANLSKINRELGTTVIITEHKLDEVLPMSNNVIVLDNGELISFDTPQNTGVNLKNSGSKIFLSLPAPMKIWYEVGDTTCQCPITVAQGREWLEKFAQYNSLLELYPDNIHQHKNEISVELKDIWFRYDKNSQDIIKGLSFKAYKGEFVSILGGNGAGKTTVLSIISRVLKPYSGKIIINNAESYDNETFIAQLPQNVQSLFTEKTVLEDLLDVFYGKKITNENKNKLLNSVIAMCRLGTLLNRHPFDLSGGEQQRAALAKLLLLRPKILLLDEPTKGIDEEFKIVFARIINGLTASGVTVIMVSHDIDFCAEYVHRCIMLFNGEVVSEGSAREFFSENSFYVTSSNRIARGIIDKAVTANDIIYCCTGKKKSDCGKIDVDLYNYDYDFDIKIKNNKPVKNEKLPLWKKILGIFSALAFIFGVTVNFEYLDFAVFDAMPLWVKFTLIVVPVILMMISFGSKSKRYVSRHTSSVLSKRTVAASAVILIAIPLTIFVGITYLNDEKYMFISLLVLIECMVPFFMIFEGRKPQARELVIIAVMCAIAIAGRTMFYMLPQFKPVIALVIISGVAFGGESGFLVGSITMLVSNIMFWQGPWTPWQMFVVGIIGFLAGVLFRKGLLNRNRGALCIFGFTASVVIYGGIMNFAAAVMSNATSSFEMIFSFYITGFPTDIVHGLSTVAFLYFCAEPMLEKLDRIKTKYSLVN